MLQQTRGYPAKSLGLAAALLLTTTLVHPTQAYAQSDSLLFVGAGGQGGTGAGPSFCGYNSGGGGGGPGGGGGGGAGCAGAQGGGAYGGSGGSPGIGSTGAENGETGTATTDGVGGAGAVGSGSYVAGAGTPGTYQYNINSGSQSYTNVIVGGGGGGGGGAGVGFTGGTGGVGGTGVISISGTGSLNIGSTGTLIVGGDGGGGAYGATTGETDHLGYGGAGGAGGAGTVTVSGAQASLTASTIALGGSTGGTDGYSTGAGGVGGSGTLTIENSARAEMGAGGVITIGQNGQNFDTGSQGALNIDSSGSLTMGDNSTITIGGAANESSNNVPMFGGGGTLNITNGGTLALGDNSTLNVGGGAYFDSGGYGDILGAAGALNMTNGSTLNLGNNTTISLTNTLSSFDLAGANNIEVDGTGSANISANISNSTNTAPGSLVKLGTGTLNLTGTNSYSGGTIINAGTVSISNDDNLGAAAGGVAFNGGTLDMTTTITSYRNMSVGANGGVIELGGRSGVSYLYGALSGTGILTITGPNGALGLAGNNNNFYGETNITAGTVLGVVYSGTLANSLVNIAANGAFNIAYAAQSLSIGGLEGAAGSSVLLGQNSLTVQLANGSSEIFSGVISGTGGLSVTGGGQLTLMAANQYYGGTVIGTGATLIGSTQSFYSGNISNNGNLVINQATAGTLRNVMSGTGVLSVTGIGPLTLANSNSYSGGTFINTGASLIGSSQSFGSGNIINNGNLTINQTNASKFSNSIAGTGHLTVAGTGPLTLAGDNNYSGGITIDQGAVVVATSQSLGIGDVDNEGTLKLNQATLCLLSNNISGAGGVVVQGGGGIIINSENSYTGATDIENGTLEVGDIFHPNASLTGAVFVGQAGILSGHGTVGDVTNSGIVAPGGTIGRLMVNGNYTQTSMGNLDIQLTPLDVAGVGYDQLKVNGTAQLSGSLNVSVESPSAGGFYTPGLVYHVLTAAGGIGTSKFTAVTAVFPAAYAKYLTTQTLYSPNAVNIELRASPALFLTGKFYGASSRNQNSALFSVISAPLQADTSYWMHGIGSFGHAPDATENYKGYVIGHGFQVNHRLIIGGAFSNVYTNMNGVNNATVSGTSIGVEAYGIYSLPQWRFSAMAGGGWLNSRSNRPLSGIGVGRSTTTGDYAAASLRAQYNGLNWGHVFAVPYTQASYLHTHSAPAQESGMGGMDMNYGRINIDQARIGGGLKSGYKTPTPIGILTVWGEVGGVGVVGDTHIHVHETIATQSEDISAQIASAGLFTPAAGIQLAGHDRPWKLAAVWHGQFAQKASDQAFTLQGSYKF